MGLIHLTALVCTQLSGFNLIAHCHVYSLTDSPLAWTTPQLIIAFLLRIEIRQWVESPSFSEDYSHVYVRTICMSIGLCASQRYPCRSARRVHLSSGHTYQVDSPIGLDLKLTSRALREPPKTPLGIIPERSPSVLALGHLRGQFRQL